LEPWLLRLSEKVHPALLGSVSLILLLGGYAADRGIRARIQILQEQLRALAALHQQSSIALNHYQSLSDLKTQDTEKFKQDLSNIAQSKKTLFEAGLSTQEERRLLEKQWEIMTTYLTVNTSLQRIFLMRGDQPLESYLINYVPIKALGGAPPTVPHVVRIVSKERFANPERGQSEMINGKLQWEPPQVGTSVRSNALGEYVLFTNSRLILHGPPRNSVDHEAFPHLCLGLSREAARNIYQHSFVGTKLLLPGVRAEVVPSEVPPPVVVTDSATPKIP
jgi:hypothetical protein